MVKLAEGFGYFGMVHFGMLVGFCETPRKEPAGRDWRFFGAA